MCHIDRNAFLLRSEDDLVTQSYKFHDNCRPPVTRSRVFTPPVLACSWGPSDEQNLRRLSKVSIHNFEIRIEVKKGQEILRRWRRSLKSPVNKAC